MGFDIDQIKNPHVRKRLLELKAKEKPPRPLTGYQPPPLPPPPEPVPSESLSTIDQPQPEKSTEIFFLNYGSIGKGKTEIFFTVNGEPMGKPRMTQRDKWQKRPCVIRYREYCDKIRAQAGDIPENPLAVHIRAYIPVSASWSKKKKAAMIGQRQRLKPDWDNIGKAICDALFDEDSCIAVGITEKFWCEEGKQRTEVIVIYEESVLQRYGIGIDQR